MSIRTHNTHPKPRFTEHLLNKKAFADSPIAIIDVGARGGAGSEWSVYGDAHTIVGFEADSRECERLNAISPKNQRYYPGALWSKKAKKKFYIHGRHAPTSSFYDSDERLLSRFPGSLPWMPDRTITLQTTDFASFARKNRIEHMDVMKLDVEGAELEIMRGIGKRNFDKILCLNFEAYFASPFKGAPTFADVDTFVRKNGFVLYDLPILRWEKKSTSPYMFTDGIFGPTDKGQIAFTQALYFRDAVTELKNPRMKKMWTPTRILKLASLMELFQHEDSALELLGEARSHGILRDEKIEEWFDLLTPRVDGQEMTYAAYVEHIRRIGPPRYIAGRRVSQEEYAAHQKKKK